MMRLLHFISVMFLLTLGFSPKKTPIHQPDYVSLELGDRLNIVWIVAEDLSAILPPYGDSTVATPNISRLAEEGVRYTHFFSPSGVCAPSRAAIATGMYPTRIGAHHMRTGPWFRFTTTDKAIANYPRKAYEAIPPAGTHMLSSYLRRAGYFCTNNPKEDYQFRCELGAWDESNFEAHWKHRPDPEQPFFAIFNLDDTHESMIWRRAGDTLLVDSLLDVPVPPYLPATEVALRDLRRLYSNIVANLELFDLRNDPDELHNIIGEPQYAEKVNELRQALDNWIAETEDKGRWTEEEYLEQIWPGGQQPITETPVIQVQGESIVLRCATQGAQVAYQWATSEAELTLTWTIYQSPVMPQPGKTLFVQAHRIGYRPSGIEFRYFSAGRKE